MDAVRADNSSYIPAWEARVIYAGFFHPWLQLQRTVYKDIENKMWQMQFFAKVGHCDCVQ